MKTILLFLLFFTSNFVFAQRILFGFVTDKSGNPIENVRVSLINTNFQTFTNIEGKYSIEISEENKILEFSKKDFRTQELEATNEKELNVTLILLSDVKDIFDLSLEELMLLEVVSSTKFAQKQSSAPNVISIVKNDATKNFAWHSINDVLFKQAGFSPSQDYDRITTGARGIPEGWNNNHLLLLIDGIPFNSTLYGTATTNEFTPLIFTKTLEIIKGPGSALYGSNATNGVITLNSFSANDFEANKIFVNIQNGEKNTNFYDILGIFKTNLLNITSSLSYFCTDGEKYSSFDGSLEMDSTNHLKKFEPQNERFGGYFFLKIEGKEKIKGLSMQIHSQITNTKTGHGWLWNIPDNNENIRDVHNHFVLKFQKNISRNFKTEIVAKYSLHFLDWDMWYYRKGAFDNFYPKGVNEYLKTSFNNIFLRLQFIYKLPKNAVLVCAAEPNFFIYTGDNQHFSNTDLLNTTEGFPPLNENRSLGAYLELIKNKPTKNIGSFLQFSTGEILGKYLQLTAGVRYDINFFDYSDVSLPEKPVRSKKFDEISPRASLVIAPTEKVTLKILALTAFRAPSPTELFGYNTWAIASNINELKPERIKSLELALDYNVNKFLNFRINSFYTISEGQIGYSLGNNNLSTNIYDLTNAGVESEILFTKNKFSVFLNATFLKKIDEKIFENELEYVSLHKEKLTWTPQMTANLGASWNIKQFQVSLQGHFQDKVLRRDNDFYSNDELASMNLTSQPRPTEVSAWFSLDMLFSYKYRFVKFGILGTNILNSDNYLVKSMKFPFDYKMDGRRIAFFIHIEM